MTRRREAQLSVATMVAVVLCTLVALTTPPRSALAAAGVACPDSLPLPSSVGEQAYEPILNQFLASRCYRGWVHDSLIRSPRPSTSWACP